MNNDLPGELRRALRNLVISTVVIYMVLAGVVAFVWIDGASQRNHIADVAESTNHALCVLRADLVQRVQDSVQFLIDHPNGIPGIPVASIQTSINNQRSTIAALSDLNCQESA